jgi:hypothetical protein
MINLLSPTFWFQIQPPPILVWSGRIMLACFSAMVILGIVAKVYGVKAGLDKLVRRAVERAGTLLLIMGLVGLLMYFISYERVPVLSMRALYLVWLFGLGLWAWSLYRYVKIEIPSKRSMAAEREKLTKWLPKANK